MKQDRRKGPDLLIKVLRWLGIFGWFVMIVALYILDMAKPEEENMSPRLQTSMCEQHGTRD